MPAHSSPFKGAGGQDPGPERRLRMCELLLAGHPGLAACAMEVKRPGPSFTVDTLAAISAASPDTRLTFIMGADTACTLGFWREPRRILQLAGLAVAERDGGGRERVLAALDELVPGARERARFLAMPPVEVSSSQVRARVAAGEPVDELVGGAVASYIAREGLYRAQGQA